LDLFLAISQGIGASIACGLRSFLPPLLVAAMARADVGVDFTGTDYSFIESVPFLVALLALNAVGALYDRGAGEPSGGGASTGAVGRLFVLAALVLGALVFAGSLAEEDYSPELGLAAGAACALLAYLSMSALLVRARSRLAARGEQGSASFLNLYADAAGLVIAALALLLPPVSYLALALCAWLLVQQRRRAGQKYEGLRVLR
jgi:hypothetical protein